MALHSSQLERKISKAHFDLTTTVYQFQFTVANISSQNQHPNQFLTLSQTILGFPCLQYKSFENTVGKGEIACNKQLLLFH